MKNNKENIWSPSMEPHMDRRPTYNGVRPGSPRGSFMTLQSLPQSPVSQPPCSNPHQDVPSTAVTASHVTQGRIEYESTIT